jgi:hypothetical protein
MLYKMIYNLPQTSIDLAAGQLLSRTSTKIQVITTEREQWMILLFFFWYQKIARRYSNAKIISNVIKKCFLSMFYSFKALQREATERRQQETFPMASVL